MTGMMVPSIVRVSKGEMKKRSTMVPIMKIKDLTNIETFVLRPS